MAIIKDDLDWESSAGGSPIFSIRETVCEERPDGTLSHVQKGILHDPEIAPKERKLDKTLEDLVKDMDFAPRRRTHFEEDGEIIERLTRLEEKFDDLQETLKRLLL